MTFHIVDPKRRAAARRAAETRLHRQRFIEGEVKKYHRTHGEPPDGLAVAAIKARAKQLHTPDSESETTQ